MKLSTFIFSSILLFTITVFPQGNVQRYNPFSGTIVFSIEGGVTLASTDYSGLGVDYLGRATLEYFFPAWAQSGFGLRLFGNAGFIKGEDARLDPTNFRTSIGTIGGGVVFILSINDVAFPYLFAGISHLSFNPKGEGGEQLPNNKEGKYNTSEVNFNAELGFRFPVTPNLSLNVNGGVQLSPNDWLDDKAVGTTNDLFFKIFGGISYSFLTEFDSDGDGVVDSKDACPKTPQGIKVDEFGCPVDSDNDGVPDYLDKCPDTPYDVEVDQYGCPLDSDLDGVPDYLDQCPGTLPGMQVDEKGCELAPEIPEPKFEEPGPLDEIILSSATSFDFNSAELKPTAFPELEILLSVMKKYPMSRWRIEGHTDNVGTEESNIRMSKQRAEAVSNYFISRSIPKGRFTVVGLGGKYPIDDNKSPEGREKNRRVVIIRLN